MSITHLGLHPEYRVPGSKFDAARTNLGFWPKSAGSVAERLIFLQWCLIALHLHHVLSNREKSR